MIYKVSVFCKAEEHGGCTPTFRLRGANGLVFEVPRGRGGWIKLITDYLGANPDDVADAVGAAYKCLDETEQPLCTVNITEEDELVLRAHYQARVSA
jgi:hypothetical protein